MRCVHYGDDAARRPAAPITITRCVDGRAPPPDLFSFSVNIRDGRRLFFVGFYIPRLFFVLFSCHGDAYQGQRAASPIDALLQEISTDLLFIIT